MTNTPAVFPTSLVSFTVKTNEVDVVNDDDVNKLQNEVVAMQGVIGTFINGSKTNLTQRLAVMMATNGAIAQSSGAFPGSPVEGQYFWRPDLITAYVYSSSAAAWQSLGQSLSNTIFDWQSMAMPLNGGLAAGTDVGMVSGAGYTPTFPSINAKQFIAVKAGVGFCTFYHSKFRKISGISSVLCYASIWTKDGSSGIPGARFTIGSVSGTTAYGTANQTSPEWKSVTLSISALTAGTVYDVIAEICGSSDLGYVNAIKGIGI